MDKFTPPTAMVFTGNVHDHWKKWKQELELYLTATEAEGKPEKVKSSILLTCIGPKGREIYNTFEFTDATDKMKMSKVIEQFDQYCTPRQNLTYLRHKFLTYRQKEGQAFDEFVTQLRKLSSECEFGTLCASLIKDIIVIGIIDNRLRERMLRDSALTLERAINMGQSSEETSKHIKELQPEESRINIVKKRAYTDTRTPRRNNPQGETNMINQCMYCGGKHNRGSCPAYSQQCRKCGKKGHFASCCKSTNNQSKVNQIEMHSNLDNPESGDEFYVGAVFSSHNSDNQSRKIFTIDSSTTSWNVSLSTDGTNINYQIDTGAEVNVLPKSCYRTLNRKPRLLQTDVKLTAYNGTTIPVLGRCISMIKRNGKNIPTAFIVAETLSPPVLGAKSSENLNLIKRIMSVNTQNTDLISEYSDCFGELGTLPKTHHIRTNPDIPPVIHSARRIPIALRERLSTELQRMVKMGVIEPVTEPTEWVSQLVVAEKPNGKLRVCLDPRDLNKAILRHHYQLPTAEELFSEMANAKYFTKLDASNGYWQIKVSDESSNLLTFASPDGRFKFKRLPYGIHSASEVFQAEVAEMIRNIPGSRNSQDDILIWGDTLEINQSRTKQVLEVIRNYGLKLNKSKCVFNAHEITFLGHQISSKGLSPDPVKVIAISDMPYPNNKSEIKTFLGMVAYLGKFITHLTEATAPLRSLTEKESIWEFTENHKLAFNKIKSLKFQTVPH